MYKSSKESGRTRRKVAPVTEVAMLRHAITAAGGAAYYIDRRTSRHACIEEQIERLTGYSTSEMSDETWGRMLGDTELKFGSRSYGGTSEETMPPCDFAAYEIETNQAEKRWIANHAMSVLDAEGAEIGIAGLLQDVSGMVAAREHLQHQYARLMALRTIDLAILSFADLAATLGVVLNQVLSLLTVDCAAILLLDRTTNLLRFAAGQGLRADVSGTDIPLGRGVAGLAAERAVMAMVSDLPDGERDHYRSDLLAQEGIVEYFVVPLIARGAVVGVLEIYHRSQLTVTPDWHDYLDALAGQTAIAIDSDSLFHGLQKSNRELEEAYDATIEGWVQALDMRDKETEGHSRRVVQMTDKLARMLGFSEDELVNARRGALLHDIGKMGIPDHILMKPGPLSPEEWDVMRKHPVYAKEMLSSIAFLRPALEIPFSHHERWDGTGYPQGLRGTEIPLAARIFAVIDVYDALTNDRPYRSAWTQHAALDHIRQGSGTHFDSDVVHAFLRIMLCDPAIS